MSLLRFALLLLWLPCIGLAAKPPKQAALEAIEHLGLPDVRQAQWVSIEYTVHVDTFGDPPGPDRRREVEHAWLVDEDARGRLTLIVNQAEWRVGRRATDEELDFQDESDQPLAEVPLMVVKPAQLDTEIADLSEDLRNVKKDAASLAAKGEKLSGRETLLFLAQLHTRHRPEVASLLALLPDATFADLLDDALDALADGRLQKLNDDWVDTGDATRYAAGLERLIKEIDHGWENREAAQILARQVREEAGRPPENDAARLLLSLRRTDLPRLPIEVNWLLPQSAKRWTTKLERGDQVIAEMQTADEFFMWDDQAVRRELPREDDTSVRALFQRGEAAVVELATLLESRRPLRLIVNAPACNRDRGGGAWTAAERYGSIMRRPCEMRELAATLADSVLPDLSGRYESADRLKPKLQPWIEQITGKSSEEIAWAYVRNAEFYDNDSFREALAWLVEKHSPATLAELQKFLLDPIVWTPQLVVDLAQPLPKLLSAVGDQRQAFGNDLTHVLKQAVDSAARHESGSPYITFDGPADLRALDQILHPHSFPELLAELIAAREANFGSVLAALQVARPERYDAEMESQVFQTAVQIPTHHREELLALLRSRPASFHRAPPMEESTRKAINALLNHSDGQLAETYEIALQVLLQPRVEPGMYTQWTSLWHGGGNFPDVWNDEAAAAILLGMSLPPIPSGAPFTSQEVAALARPWAAQTQAQVVAAVRALPLETQWRLLQGLTHYAPWPEPLALAQLTIVDTSNNTHDGFEPERIAKWKGRVFDQSLRDELVAMAKERAIEGHYVIFRLEKNDSLFGLSLTAEEFRRRGAPLQREELAAWGLPGLKASPSPDGAVIESIYITKKRLQTETLTEIVTPLWKDAARTAAWARRYGQLPGKPAPAVPDARDAPVMSDPKAFQGMLDRTKARDARLLLNFHYEVFGSYVADPSAEPAPK